MSRAIVLCADDYGHSAPISRAILDLARLGRISALSCMTASPLLPEHGPWLQAVKDKLDIGLHLTLVDETPLTKMPNTAPDGKLPGIRALILKCYFGQLDFAEIEAEIRAQMNAFTAVMGAAPHHIDGHLHTHVLPGVRDIVLKIASELSPRPWLRNIADSYASIAKRGIAVPKALFLAALGNSFAQTTVSMNDTFSGVYDFAPDSDYAALFPHFLRSAGQRHLILCHPGEANDTAAHAMLRAREYAYLKSDGFLESLAARDIRIGRFAETAPSIPTPSPKVPCLPPSRV